MFVRTQVDKQRIVLLYEQAKHSVLTEEVDCTEEEAFTFAALKVRERGCVDKNVFEGRNAAMVEMLAGHWLNL